MNHYEWLKKNLPIFFENLNLDTRHCDSIISAHGDKCYGQKTFFEKNGIHFYHGCAMYLMLSMYPYSEQVRQTEKGWVNPFDWIVNHNKEFISYLPKI